jgi:hypothetical protein
MRRIVVSGPTIRDVARNATRFSENAQPFGYLYGRMVGRVIAHELGHLLLNSPRHARFGLMRPVFGTRDVETDDPRAFALLPHDVKSLEESVMALSAAAWPDGTGCPNHR